MAVIVKMTVMMAVMIQARGCPIPLPAIRMTRVQRVHWLKVVMMIVNVIQSAVRPGIGVRRRGLAGYAGADMMMVHAGVSGQAAGRAAMMVAD